MIFNNTKTFLSYLYALPKKHSKSDLSYIQKILHVLGDPQDRVKTIHVTGTNGKGSTSYYLSHLLEKAGQKTGLFVSPYVFEFGERMQIDGKNMTDSAMLKTANQIENALYKIRKLDPDFSLVTFEYEVAMSFVYFAKEKCDFAVIEVGIGGQHDKTNVIIPEVSIITTIGLDHEKIIGPTIQDIAYEKSGIIKKNRPLVVGNIPREVMPIINKRAVKQHAACYKMGQNFKIFLNKKLIYQDNEHHLSFLPRPKVESYDIAVALKAFFLLQLQLSDRQIIDTINQTVIPGRYQILQAQPLIILDGAHNQQAMKNLLNFVHQQQNLRKATVRILIMIMRDKDLDPIFSLFKETDRVNLTTIDYPRAAKLEDFPKKIKNKYPYWLDWKVAYASLKHESKSNDILVVTGSFYLVGNILRLEESNESSRD
ncbi:MULTISPECIES: folylpolyglutamate synthase/dihydrofolate synthase family protein [unclassified Lactobacillus]|uniref:bifunctional folylpolyglutamate synthase/dihydrofolate synthase n=1 Tax=unclassified Lactobacillus TaxID=2620435 RepID=UPI000EFD5450|nr:MULTISPECIES: folylpolyglutamate synthase/dihydrofolate synthase family protein [unclassified Lactobacillus]RMC25090.1 bifunctional folylpolyglutamate synthase/dihydrofolate synthase [Lactobacillus sp. ESL0247]RMC29245.1 bifunctional folylpolyglutamate synthase/dihydrofolate synthase [Lactobacillus sp. ESL0246]RMC32265.1 bifunctional folylpolyglutamate synthase/dihydrofolate synthase [Lactobacillus sp. ESL0245]